MKLATILISCLLASAAQAQDARVWMVQTPKDNDAWLRYATPGTDDQPLAFRCVPKSGQVSVSAVLAKPVGARLPASVTVASAPASATLRGSVEPDLVTDGALASAEFSTRAPVVEAFRKTGLVSVAAQGETMTPPPAPKGVVRKFFGACR
ncbi:hypothetical protein [Phenylobacterium sp.]|uniref:hypothetical protein n=1 Tax=Phenylobacterium sp. TaxID=1871053 RepID=UPI002736A9CE|nr:hypothetical protein [Phenylobacterium sp.]MDP3855896.1 hypothetical protein [Phenylobacterium sp.]